jgi:TolB-like protein
MARRDPEILSTLLDRALSLPSEARATFLEEQCKDDRPLRDEIRSLLIAHDASSGYFERISDQIVSPALMALSADVGDELLVGQTFAQYRIVEKLATGGMGVVFKALDQRLDRFVALKFLPAPLSADADAKRRLLTEAKAASALDHPNIGVVHDIGETAAGRLFIVMGYYEGETLERKNERGAISIEEALALTRQIAGALAAAHQHGIVHRDVKPSNILITAEGTAKLLDFGIAMLAGSKPPRDGTVVGTVAYMSPEQTRGVIVDHRSDLWSLGVVLYEMITGLRPFRADDNDALIYAIRHDRWEPVDRVTSGMPSAVTGILRRCLAKDSEDRYRTAEELISDLEAVVDAKSSPSGAATGGTRWRWLRYASAAAVLCVIAVGILYVQNHSGPLPNRAAGVQTRTNRLAVLPVTLVESDAAEGYLAVGMTQELIAQLSRIAGLRVIAQSSVMGYRDGTKTPAEIGRELSAESVLRSSVRKAGGQLQISMQLVDTRTQEQLWTTNYTAPPSDLQSLQREIALRVAEVLRVQVSSPEQRQLARAGTSSADAYLFYLRGLHFLDKRNDQSVRQAKDYFEQALDLDPAFARAWTGLGDAYSALSALAAIRAADAYPQSRAAAERALQIDPDLPEAHVTLATSLSTYYWHFDAAADHYRRALELNPSYANAHRLYAEYLRFEGRFDEALAAARHGEELDPLSQSHRIETGVDLYWARRYDEAIAQFRRVLDVNPQFTYARFFLALVLVQKQQYDEALSALNQPGAGGSLQQETLRGYIHAVTGRKAEARKGLDRLALLSRTQNVSSWHSAIIHMGLGEHDRALDLIEQAYRDHDWQVRMLPVEPLLDPLHSHPRFRVLADRVR